MPVLMARQCMGDFMQDSVVDFGVAGGAREGQGKTDGTGAILADAASALRVVPAKPPALEPVAAHEFLGPSFDLLQAPFPRLDLRFDFGIAGPKAAPGNAEDERVILFVFNPDFGSARVADTDGSI